MTRGPFLVIRPSGGDAALVNRLTTAAPGVLARPYRIVLDAPTATKHPEFSRSAVRRGIAVQVDPMTYFLQDSQHPHDPWALLPFGHASALTPADFNVAYQQRLVATTIEHQINTGATHLIVPYVYIEQVEDGWLDVQISLYRHTRAFLDNNGINLDLTCLVALGWRLLDRTTWHLALDRLLSAAADVDAAEIALAGSRVDQGTRPDQRLAALLATTTHCAGIAPVVAWNQGIFGEACVAAGAAGYETGIGWRERCDLPTQMRGHRAPPPPPGTPRSRRPVYIDQLRRSIERATLVAAAGHRSIAPDLPCPATDPCCPNGLTDLLGDARLHAITARARSLHQLAETDTRWRWSHLGSIATTGLALAQRINAAADRTGSRRVNTAALEALDVCAATRRRLRSGRWRAA